MGGDAGTDRAAASPRAEKIRGTYLKYAKRDVESRLKATIHYARFLDLGIEDDPTAIRQPWGYQDPDSKNFYQGIVEAFEKSDGRLLILGHPGSGKSTALLHLAQELIRRAEQSADAAVPFVLNLSKFRLAGTSGGGKGLWSFRRSRTSAPNAAAEGDSTFIDWLAAEMSEFPGLTRSQAREWIRDGRVAVLLDGLDEFGDERRADLTRLLNETFLRHYPDTATVICSRSNAYAVLRNRDETRLRLQGAVQLQPLSDAQIASYLDAAQAKGLMTALPEDSFLQELARTPLTLSMLVLAYGGLAPESAPAGRTLSERRYHLFESYVARMLQRQARRENNQPFDTARTNDVSISKYRYRPEEVNRWLSWLAVVLSMRTRTSFALRDLHSILCINLKPANQLLTFFAVFLALTPVLAIAVAGTALPLVPYSVTAWMIIGVMIATGALLLPIMSAGVREWNTPSEVLSLVGITLVVVVDLAAIAHALAALVHLPITVVPLSAMLGGVALTAIRGNDPPAALRTGLTTAAALALVHAGMDKGHLQIVVAALGLGWVLLVSNEPYYSLSERAATFFAGTASGGLIMAGAAMLDFDWRTALLAITGTSVVILSGVPSVSVPILTGFALTSALGGVVAGTPGSILGGAAFGMCLIVGVCLREAAGRRMVGGRAGAARATRLNRTGAWAFGIYEVIQSTLLSSCTCGILAVPRLFPRRARPFIAFCNDAFLLKRSAREVEFAHRLLRDYFALRELLPRVNVEDTATRLETIRSLGHHGESAFEILAELSQHPDPLVRAAAVTGVSYIASPLVSQCLEARIHDQTPEVRRALIPALFKLPDSEAADLMRKLVPVGDGCEVEPLLVAMRERQYRSIAEAMFFRCGPSLVIPLVSRLQDRDPGIRTLAAQVLGGIGDRQSVEPLIERLDDPQKEVRIAAAVALGLLGDSRAQAPLEKRLYDRNKKVREVAKTALGRVRQALR